MDKWLLFFRAFIPLLLKIAKLCGFCPETFARRSTTWTRSAREIPWKKKASLEALLRWWQPARASRGGTLERLLGKSLFFMCLITDLAGNVPLMFRAVRWVTISRRLGTTW